MAKYIIKSLCTFEIEALSHDMALDIYNQGLWSGNNIVDEHSIELGYYDETDDYHTLQED